MSSNRTDSIEENKSLCRKLVYAVNKAITQDLPQSLRDNWLETNNRYIFAPSDYINENLRNHVAKDEVILLPFNRSVWEGRIIVDKANKTTYTISSHNALKSVIKKHRNRPHYLMSLLYTENADCVSPTKQITFCDLDPDFNMDGFAAEDYAVDYDKIMQGSIRSTDGYKHYIVAYTVEQHMIVKIELLLLDKDFATVDSKNLIEYVTPDFVSLTERRTEESDMVKETNENVRPSLLKLKPGVKPAFKAIEEDA